MADDEELDVPAEQARAPLGMPVEERRPTTKREGGSGSHDVLPGDDVGGGWLAGLRAKLRR